jgi:hypothetical protein
MMKRTSKPSYNWAAILVGVLHILVSMYGLLCGVCGGFKSLMSSFATAIPDNGAQNWQISQLRYLQANVLGYSTMEWTRPFIILMLSVMILIAGIGLFSMHGWGRGLTLVCSVLMLLWQIADIAHRVIFVIPAEKAWVKDFEARGPKAQLPPEARELPGTEDLWFFANAGLFIAYAAISGGLLVLPGVGAAFARWAEWRGHDPGHDPDDDDLYEPGRLKKSRRRRDEDDDEDDDDD